MEHQPTHHNLLPIHRQAHRVLLGRLQTEFLCHILPRAGQWHGPCLPTGILARHVQLLISLTIIRDRQLTRRSAPDLAAKRVLVTILSLLMSAQPRSMSKL